MASGTAASLVRLQQKAVQAEQLVSLLRTQINSLQQTAVANACRVQQEKLQAENAVLRREVERLQESLRSAEIRNGVKQVPLPIAKTCTPQPSTLPSLVICPTKPLKDGRETLATENVKKAAKTDKKAKVDPSEKSTEAGGMKEPCAASEAKPPASEAAKIGSAVPAAKSGSAAAKSGSAADKSGSADDKSKPAAAAKNESGSGSENIDVSRLNMRIGFIVSAKKHPDADALYVEDVDVGEGKNRTIVSGLVKHIPLEQMQQRFAVFLLNLKPAKMRGVTSEGMIMCASTPEKVEIIEPPSGVAVGDRVIVEEYPGSPDDQLNPKKKVWEQIQPDLRINGQGLATYKGALWKIDGKGTFKAPTLVDTPIK